MGIFKNLFVVFLLLLISCAGTKDFLEIDISELSKKQEVVYYDPALFGGWCHDNGTWIHFGSNGMFYMASGFPLPNAGPWKNIGDSLYIDLAVIDKVIENDSLYFFIFKPEEEKYRGTYDTNGELLGMTLGIIGHDVEFQFILNRCEE